MRLGEDMPILLNNVEYLTTQEAMVLTDMSRTTWRTWSEKYGLKHYTRVGKGKQYLWQKSDVEKLLEVEPEVSNG